MAKENNIEQLVLDIDWLKSNYTRLYYFGLGFIQLKISDTQRVHFYTNEFPLTSKDEIHNHRYCFTSKILKGQLEQELYFASENKKGDWVIRKESCKKDFKAESEIISCDLEIISKKTFYPGSEYWIEHQTFHKVFSTNAITLLTTEKYNKELADVISPKNIETFICPFSIEVPQDRLFEVIAKRIQND